MTAKWEDLVKVEEIGFFKSCHKLSKRGVRFYNRSLIVQNIIDFFDTKVGYNLEQKNYNEIIKSRNKRKRKTSNY